MPNASSVAATPNPAAVVAKATLSAAVRLGLSNRQLAAVIGTSEASVSRLQRGRGIDPDGKEGELALMLVRLFRSLDALVGGDEDKRKLWMSTSNRELNGVPLQLVKKVDGLLRVLAYLDVMRAPS